MRLASTGTSFDTLIAKATAKEQEARYASCSEFLKALDIAGSTGQVSGTHKSDVVRTDHTLIERGKSEPLSSGFNGKMIRNEYAASFPLEEVRHSYSVPNKSASSLAMADKVFIFCLILFVAIMCLFKIASKY